MIDKEHFLNQMELILQKHRQAIELERAGSMLFGIATYEAYSLTALAAEHKKDVDVMVNELYKTLFPDLE